MRAEVCDPGLVVDAVLSGVTQLTGN